MKLTADLTSIKIFTLKTSRVEGWNVETSYLFESHNCVYRKNVFLYDAAGKNRRKRGCEGSVASVWLVDVKT